MLKECIVCKKEFKVKSSIFSTRKTCSLPCKWKITTKKKEVTCQVCSNLFTLRPSEIEKGYRCCSKSCSTTLRHQEGKFPDIKKGELNTNWKGGKPSCMECGNKVSTYHGKRCADCWAQYLSDNLTGENNHNWNGGTSSWQSKLRGSPLWRKWREFVFKRDDYKCLDCGDGGYLEPHHIIPLRVDSTKVYEINNGITLCRPCHQKTFGKEEQFADTYKMFVARQVN